MDTFGSVINAVVTPVDDALNGDDNRAAATGESGFDVPRRPTPTASPSA